jgi:hypothetical protein
VTDVGDNEAPPTVVLPLDQAEELLSPVEYVRAAHFLRLLGELVAPSEGTRLDMIVAATIRSDLFGGLQTRPELADAGIELFGELKPMTPEQFKEVITGPAERVTADGRPLKFAPDLIEQLLADLIKDRLEESETLQQQAQNNSLAQFSASPDLQNEFVGAVIGAMDSSDDLSTQILNNPDLSQKLLAELVPIIYKGLKAAG